MWSVGFYIFISRPRYIYGDSRNHRDQMEGPEEHMHKVTFLNKLLQLNIEYFRQVDIKKLIILKTELIKH